MTLQTLRVPGALFLAALGFQAGIAAEAPYRRRLQSLKGWGRALARVESEIRHGHRDLEAAVRLAARDAPEQVAGALTAFAETVGETVPTAVLWVRAVASDADLLNLDREVLEAVGPVLGRYAPEEQGRHLEQARMALSRLEAEADGALRARGRALRVLMGLGGAALAVLVV
ncbi:MAG: stage III sporulation protein AB [Clostridia bacterium]